MKQFAPWPDMSRISTRSRQSNGLRTDYSVSPVPDKRMDTLKRLELKATARMTPASERQPTIDRGCERSNSHTPMHKTLFDPTNR